MHFNDVFTPTFSQLLQSLLAEAVPFLIIGGHAVGIHGYVSATTDLDLWIEPDERHTKPLGRALRSINVGLPLVELMRHLRESDGLRLGGDYGIDLLFRVAGVDFAPSYARRIEVEVEGVMLPFIGLIDLRASKRAAGRSQDLADLDNLPPA